MQGAEYKLKLNTAQHGYIKSVKPEVFIYGGRGLGKTFIEGLDTYDCAAIGKTVQLLVAPTLDQLRNSTLKQLQESWHKIGIVEGEHYIISERPDESWGVKSFSRLSNHRIITWRNGSYIMCDSLDNFDKHRGAEYDRITVDEFQNVDPESRKVLLGCRRGKRMQELGLPIQVKYGLTPPNDVKSFLYLRKLIEELYGTDSADFFKGTSFDNRNNLPDDYIDTMEKGLSEKDVQREVYGELVMDEQGNYIYSFDESKHLKGVKINESEPLYIWMDFNIGVMATTVWQFNLTEGWCYCIDEFEPRKNIDILDRCDTIKAKYGHMMYQIIVTGDPASGNSGLKKNVNYYTSIQSELNLQDWQLKIKKHHPDSRDAQVLCNSMFSRYPDLKIHPRCGNLIHDLKFCVTDDNGKLDKTNHELTHYLDTMVYGFDFFFKGWYLNK